MIGSERADVSPSCQGDVIGQYGACWNDNVEPHGGLASSRSLSNCRWLETLVLVHLLEELLTTNIDPLLGLQLLEPPGGLSAELVEAGFTSDHHSQGFPDDLAGIFIKAGGDFLVNHPVQRGGEFDLHGRSDVKGKYDGCDLRVPR